MASPVIADPFHRMKYMERHGSGLRKIVRETEKPPGYTAAYNPKIFSTATDFRVILKNVNYQLSQKNLVNDQVSEQDKSPDIPHTVLNLCIHLIAHGSEGAQITHAHSIMGTANDKSYDATHDATHDKILAFCIEPHSKLEIAEHCGYKNTKNFTQKYLRPLLNNGTLKMTLPDKPKSKHQKYITVRSE